MGDPTWLGQSPDGVGWRYMHDDGRVEDLDPTAMGMPADWRPPGFERDPAQTNYTSPEIAAPGAGAGPVTPTEPPLMGSERPEPMPRIPAGGSQTISTSRSARGSTATPRSANAASDAINARADADATGQAAAYEPVFADQAVAALEEARLLGLQSDVKRDGLAEQAITMRNQQEERDRELGDIDAKATAWSSEIHEAMNSIPTIDSHKLFNDASTAQTAALAISAFMGGFLQPVLGTNAPMDIINKAIDRSVADQTAAAEQAQRKVWNLKDLAKTDMDAALWQLNEADVSRLGHLTALERDVDAKMQGYQSQVMRNNGNKLKAEIGKSRLDLVYNIKKTSRAFMEDQYHNRYAERMQAMAESRMQRESNARMAADAGKVPKVDPRAVRDPATGAVVGYLRGGTDGQVSEYNAKQAGSFNAARNILKFKDVTARVGDLWKEGNFGSTPEAQELRSVYYDLIGDIVRSKTGAAATEGERTQMMKIIPLDKVGSPENTRSIENYVNKIVDDQNSLNSASLEPLPGEQTLGYNFNGSVDRLRAEFGSKDASLPDTTMSRAALMVRSARNPAELREAAKAALEAAREGSSVDSGRAQIEVLRDMLAKTSLEDRSLPSVDGDEDPVRTLDTILETGKLLEKARNTAPSAPVEPYYQGD